MTSARAASTPSASSPCRLSVPAILAGCVIIALPMFGDYYTPDLLSGSPNTTLIGNQINLYVRGGQQLAVGAALVVVLMVFSVRADGVLLYRHGTRRSGGSAVSGSASGVEPVGAAALPARSSRFSTWRGRSSRSSSRSASRSTRALALDRPGLVDALVLGRPETCSVWHDPDLRSALFQSLKLAGDRDRVTVPLGVALAIGLTRWRGRTAAAARFTALIPLVTPEIVMGVALFLVFVNLFAFIPLGTVGAGDRPRHVLARRSCS